VRRAAFAMLLCARAASADDACRVVDVVFTPTDELQIVAWIETADGTFVDTIYITNKVGRYGLGNRPGVFDFNSGPVVHDMEPYGKRITTFPVWAHRHGRSWPEVVFQNDNETDIGGGPFSQASEESTPPYCRPMLPSEPAWDVGTCATRAVWTDKGKFSATETSLYPPRSNLMRATEDSPSVDLYQQMNPFDAVTHATPVGGAQTGIAWTVPNDLPNGDYVTWIEVGKAFDFNATYNPTTIPPPTGRPWTDYGAPYRGQPSIAYAVHFTLGTTVKVTSTQTYAGYGDPEGATGVLNPPDATITTDTPGSGASRLELLPGSSDRVNVCARPATSGTPPSGITDLAVATASGSSATFQFTAPSTSMVTCTGAPSAVAGYEIRYRADEMTADNFASSSLAAVALAPALGGQLQTFQLDGLLPQTRYWLGIRAYDDCRNYSTLAILPFTTPDRQSGSVDACFIATAAYGSLMANDVETLRSFRDGVLRSTVFGELAIETYYTFGPSLAGTISESELLRATARAALAPVVAIVRGSHWQSL
jgi:hypothetical protein